VVRVLSFALYGSNQGIGNKHFCASSPRSIVLFFISSSPTSFIGDPSELIKKMSQRNVSTKQLAFRACREKGREKKMISLIIGKMYFFWRAIS